jgi:sulfur carrier protein ThiS
MTAQIKLSGLLKSYADGQPVILVQVTEGSLKSVHDYLISLKIPSDMIAMVLVNGVLQEKDYAIRDQDIVQLIPLIGGG